MGRERELIRAPPVRAAQASFGANLSVRRPDVLSPGGLQRRFGNQGAQMVLHAVAQRSTAQQRAAPQGSDPRTPSAPIAAQPVPSTAAVSRPEAASRPEVAAVSAQAPAAAAAGPAAVAASAATAPDKAQGQPAQPTEAAAAPKGAPLTKEALPAAKAAEPAEPAPAPNPAQAVAPVAAQVRKRARKARTHSTAIPARDLAQASGKTPKTEQARGAAVATVAAIATAETKPVESFRDKLRKALNDQLPKPTNADDAKRAMDSGADVANAALSENLTKQTDETTGGLPAAADPKAEVQADTQPAPPSVDLVPEETGPAPAPVAAGPAVPPPAPPPDLSEDRAETDKAMADAGVTKTQLAKSNEPEFTSTLQAREDAEKEEAQRAQQFETGQSGILTKQQGKTAAMLSGGLDTIHGSRDTGLGLVASQQTATKSAESKERERVTGLIQGIKNKTREDVLQILADMESSAKDCFRKGLEAAEKAYENAFEEEKGGVFNWLTNWGDDWEELINTAFVKGRKAYDRIVSQAIDDVASIIEGRLAIAKLRVERGRKEVDDFVKGLDGESARYGEEARQAIATEFDEMDGDIDAKRDEMVTQLGDMYGESQKRVAALEEKLRAANKSLWQRIYDATVGIIKKIIAFKDFLLNVLARVAQVISAIIDDPIGFLGNLIDGIIAGLERFKSNIWAHLKKGLLEWLFGALEGAGIKLPETFDLKGIVGLVMQILGLTWENVRARAVKVLGADTVAYLEKGWEVFQVLIKEGPAGLWKMLVEKVGDIKEMIITQVGEFVKEKIIFAGIKWVLSLLNPVAAFIKACMAIYDIVKFFIERAEQIAALINAILDTLGAIVRGNVSAMATAVENALAKLIPVAIGFLASLLNLGGISDKIRNVIMKLRAPVNAAIDWIIGKAAALVKKGIGFLTKKADAAVNKVIKATDKRTPEEKQRDLDRAAKSLRPVLKPLLQRGISPEKLKPLLFAWRLRYRLNALTLQDGRIVAKINPEITLVEGWTFEDTQVFLIVDKVAADYMAEAHAEAAQFERKEEMMTAKQPWKDRKEVERPVEVSDVRERTALGKGVAAVSGGARYDVTFGTGAKGERLKFGVSHEQAPYGGWYETYMGVGGGGAGPEQAQGHFYNTLRKRLAGQPVGDWVKLTIDRKPLPPEAAPYHRDFEEFYGLFMAFEPAHAQGRNRRDLIYSAMAVDLMQGPHGMPVQNVIGKGGLHPAAFGGAQKGAEALTNEMFQVEGAGKLDEKTAKKKDERRRRERATLQAWFAKHADKMKEWFKNKDKRPIQERKPTLQDVEEWVRLMMRAFMKEGGPPTEATPQAPEPEEKEDA